MLRPLKVKFSLKCWEVSKRRPYHLHNTTPFWNSQNLRFMREAFEEGIVLGRKDPNTKPNRRVNTGWASVERIAIHHRER